MLKIPLAKGWGVQFQGALHKQQHEGEAAWAKTKTAGALPTNPKAAVFKNVQGRVMDFAMENAELALTYAGKICNALTVRDIVALQTQFAQDQMQAFITQTQQLFSVIGEVVQRSERGTMGASMGAMPSNFMTAGFKDVQDRALHIARENAESVFAFAGKISNALPPQDIVTLQTQFAQDQMQAFAAQTQELQRLMGETLQKLQRG